jgi:hypothetical protein
MIETRRWGERPNSGVNRKKLYWERMPRHKGLQHSEPDHRWKGWFDISKLKFWNLWHYSRPFLIGFHVILMFAEPWFGWYLLPRGQGLTPDVEFPGFLSLWPDFLTLFQCPLCLVMRQFPSPGAAGLDDWLSDLISKLLFDDTALGPCCNDRLHILL